MKNFFFILLILFSFSLLFFFNSNNDVGSVYQATKFKAIDTANTDDNVKDTSANTDIRKVEDAHNIIKNLNSSYYEFFYKGDEEDFYKAKDEAHSNFFNCIEQYLLNGNDINNLIEYGISVSNYNNNSFISEQFGETLLLIYSYNDESVYYGSTTVCNWQFLLANFNGELEVIPIIEKGNFYPLNCFFQEVEGGILICTYGFIRWGLPPPAYISYWLYDGSEIKLVNNFETNIKNETIFQCDIFDNCICITSILDSNSALNYDLYEKNNNWYLKVFTDFYSLNLFYSKDGIIHVSDY